MHEIYTVEDVKKAWHGFTGVLEKKGKINLLVIMKNRAIDVDLKNHTITLFLDHDLQIDLLNEIKDELMIFIRKAIQNTNIYIKALIREAEQSKQLYTSDEKYAYLKEKFPKLELLKQTLGLEIGF